MHGKKRKEQNPTPSAGKQIVRRSDGKKRQMKGNRKRKFDARANKLMRAVVQRLLKAETKAHVKQARMKSKRKAYWSDWMVGREIVLEAIKKIVRKATVKSTRHQVAKQIKRARRVGITGELEEQLRQCPEIRDTNKKWDRFATKTAEHITTAQRQLGARIRRKEKMNIKEKIKKD